MPLIWILVLLTSKPSPGMRLLLTIVSCKTSFENDGGACVPAPQSISQLLAGVDYMTQLVEAADFNIFEKAQAERWKYMCMEFDQTNAALIAATGNLIDVTFRWTLSCGGLRSRHAVKFMLCCRRC